MRHWKLLTAAALIVGAAAAGVAWASIPDSNGVIHGCYKQNDGKLRVIDPGGGDACAANEASISWNSGPPHVVVRSETQTLNPGVESTFTAHCHAGEVATGGGYRIEEDFDGTGHAVRLTVHGDIPTTNHSEPLDGDVPTGWKIVGARNDTTIALDATVWAACASA